MQAYELLRVDLPAEEAMLAAAAPPGLLEHAHLRWEQRHKRAKVRHTSLSELAHGQSADIGLWLEYLSWPGKVCSAAIDCYLGSRG